MRDLIPMIELLKEVTTSLGLEYADNATTHSTVFEDNSGALSLASSPKITPRTKHIAVKYHFFRHHCGPDKEIHIQKIDSANQKADIFTKGLPPKTFEHIRGLIMGW